MIRGGLLLAILLTACAGQPAIAPTPSTTLAPASAPPTVAAGRTPSPSPTVEPISLPTFADVSAPSATVVWALVAAKRLFRSTDRGDSWIERTLPSALVNPDIAFISDAEGWIAVPGAPAAQCAQQTVALSHTSDGGASWQSFSPAGFAPAQCKEHLVFADAQHGFLSAWDPNGPPVIYRTADGGRNWSASTPLSDPPGFTTTNAGFTLRPGTVRAFGPTLFVDVVGQTTEGQKRYVFISANAGATWSYRATAPDIDGTFTVVTASRWLQLSTPGNSQESVDGGTTWHAFATDYGQAAPIAPEVVFGDAQTGYATVRGAIKRTLDGGAHWIQISTPGTF